MTYLPQPKHTAIATMNRYGAAQIPFLFIIDYLMEQCLVIPITEIQNDKILYQIGEKTNACITTEKPVISYFSKHPIPFEKYLPQFEAVMQQIALGNTYLLNLTCATPISCNLSLQEIFFVSQAKYKLWLNGQFVCFSPETFVQIIDSQIISCPMKGTINAAIPNAESLILNNLKETAEHYTIVDLIRNDLSMVAKKVRVEKFRYVDTIHAHDKTLLQVSSRIVGDLPENYPCHIGELMFRLLPAGSISGAPKLKTTEIIAAVENYPRGYYTGIFGIFDGKNLDSAVAIRFIEQTHEGLVFKSGGGITSHSSAQAEYNEMIEKIYVPVA
ncbi:MAG: aminodeoxychorismate synthase component I [Cytophagales bacterium]|nr:aminodeoxychorismate synthase component I [Bernardetiaceae bacterium]MDW8205156.1 aminodeoxychorismate synthase component I [Cytophagales bacterium]